jgi:hypothetical protein
MQAAIASSAANASHAAGNAADLRAREYEEEQRRIRFTDQGKLLPRMSSRAKLVRAIKRVDSVASFIEKPFMPTSYIPWELDWGMTRAR